jgi:hypothetical protein
VISTFGVSVVLRSRAVITAIVAAAAAAARTLFTRVTGIFLVSGVFRERSDVPAILFLDKLGEVEKQM